jgi:hypothetical protein
LSWLALLKVAQIHFRPFGGSAPRVVNKICDEVLQCHEQKDQTRGRAAMSAI